MQRAPAHILMDRVLSPITRHSAHLSGRGPPGYAQRQGARPRHGGRAPRWGTRSSARAGQAGSGRTSQQAVPHLLQQHRPPALRRTDSAAGSSAASCAWKSTVQRPACSGSARTAAATSGPAAPGSARTPAARCSRTAAAPAAPPGPASTGTATMFAVPYCTQIARPKSLPITRYDPASGRRLHAPLRRQLRQRRHRPPRLRLRPEERAEVQRQPRHHQRVRHDLRHALPRHRAPGRTGTMPCGPNAAASSCADRLRRHRRHRLHRLGGNGARTGRRTRRTVRHLVQLALVRRAVAACPAAGSRGPCRTARCW